MAIRGTSKDEIRQTWGEPSEIRDLGVDEMGLKKEAWAYNPWFPDAPLDYRHFSRKKCIYFTGNYVTGFEDIQEDENAP
jgi:hypothetical protein